MLKRRPFHIEYENISRAYVKQLCYVFILSPKRQFSRILMALFSHLIKIYEDYEFVHAILLYFYVFQKRTK